jgi:hypothetical protein
MAVVVARSRSTARRKRRGSKSGSITTQPPTISDMPAKPRPVEW